MTIVQIAEKKPTTTHTLSTEQIDSQHYINNLALIIAELIVKQALNKTATQ